MLTDGRTDRRMDGRTSSIHKPELLCNLANNMPLNIDSGHKNKI